MKVRCNGSLQEPNRPRPEQKAQRARACQEDFLLVFVEALSLCLILIGCGGEADQDFETQEFPWNEPWGAHSNKWWFGRAILMVCADQGLGGGVLFPRGFPGEIPAARNPWIITAAELSGLAAWPRRARR